MTLAFQNKLLSCLSIAVGGGLAFAGVNIHKGDERFYANYLMPAIHSLVDAERSHKIAIALARLNLVPRAPQQGDDDKHLLVGICVEALRIINRRALQ